MNLQNNNKKIFTIGILLASVLIVLTNVGIHFWKYEQRQNERLSDLELKLAIAQAQDAQNNEAVSFTSACFRGDITTLP